MRYFAALGAVAMAFALTASSASATHVQCGDTITQSTTLDSDLVNCPPPYGIRIAGVGITLDLGGHTVDGTGAVVGAYDGIRTQALGFGPADIEVRNGVVREFSDGAHLGDGPRLTARDLVATENLTGVRIADGRDGLVERVTATGNVATGINVTNQIDPIVRHNDAFGNGAGIGGGAIITNGTIAHNKVHDNQFNGIAWVSFTRGRIAHNHIEHNGLTGLSLEDGSFRNVIESNDIESNGADGILLTDGSEENVLARNRADRNGDDGIDIDWPGNTLTRNSAFFNFDLGIEAVPGTIDGGKNKARHNGNPAQCTGVTCN